MQLLPPHSHTHTTWIVFAEMENVEKDSLKDQAASVGQHGRMLYLRQFNIIVETLFIYQSKKFNFKLTP